MALNELLPQALALLPANERPIIRHQTGKKQVELTQQRYHDLGLSADVQPFIGDMAEAYGWADLVICRSGALTVSELAAAGVASVLVPYPFAVDDHQTANARYLSDEQAAVLCPQGSITPESLVSTLKPLLSRPKFSSIPCAPVSSTFFTISCQLSLSLSAINETTIALSGNNFKTSIISLRFISKGLSEMSSILLNPTALRPL